LRVKRFLDSELRGRRRDRSIACVVNERAIADRPKSCMVFDAQVRIDDDSPALDRQARALDERIRARADRAQHGRRAQEFAAREHDAFFTDRASTRSDAHCDAARRQRFVRRMPQVFG